MAKAKEVVTFHVNKRAAAPIAFRFCPNWLLTTEHLFCYTLTIRTNVPLI